MRKALSSNFIALDLIPWSFYALSSGSTMDLLLSRDSICVEFKEGVYFHYVFSCLNYWRSAYEVPSPCLI